MYNGARISYVVAMDENRVIGVNQGLPWRLPDDMGWFRDKTLGKPCLMGRKTYDSLPDQFRPLPGRKNIVLTRDLTYEAPGASVVHSLKEAFEAAGDVSEIMIVGGGELFAELMPFVDRIYLTQVDAATEGDVYFPVYEPGEWTESFCQEHPADERHAYPFTWSIIDRRASRDAVGAF